MRCLFLAVIAASGTGCQLLMSEADRDRAKIREVAASYAQVQRDAEQAKFLVTPSPVVEEEFSSGGWGELAKLTRTLRAEKITPDDARGLSAPENAARGKKTAPRIVPVLARVEPVTSDRGVNIEAASNALAHTFFAGRLSEGWARAASSEGPAIRLTFVEMLARAIEVSPDPVSFGMHVRLASMQDNLHLLVRQEIDRATSQAELDRLKPLVRNQAARSILPLVLGEAQEVNVLLGSEFDRELVLTLDAVQSLQLPESFIGVTHGQARDALVARAIQRGMALTKILTDRPPRTPDDLSAVINAERDAVQLDKDPTYALEYGRLSLWAAHIDLWRRSIQVQRVTAAAFEAKEAYLSKREWPTSLKAMDVSGEPLDIAPMANGVRISARGPERLNRMGPLLLSVDLRTTR